MWPWIVGLGALYLVAKRPSGAAVAEAAATDDVARAVAAAIQQETDPNVLLDFSAKLRAAGRDAAASAVGARAIAIHPLAGAVADIRPGAIHMVFAR